MEDGSVLYRSSEKDFCMHIYWSDELKDVVFVGVFDYFAVKLSLQ
jgi:hypothetical protein